jgi:phage major head subunit gpT-like protein
MSILDDQAEPANVATTGLVVVTPPETYIDFTEALQAQNINATTNVLAGAARVVAFSRITAASVFYVFKTDAGIRPFILQDREPLEFKALAEGSSEEFLREKHYYGVRARYRMTYGLWQHALKVTFTE